MNLQIVAVVDSYVPGFGGAQAMLHTLLLNEVALGATVRVLRLDDIAHQPYVVDGIEVAYVRRADGSALRNADVVLSQDWAAVPAATAARQRHLPYVQFVHDTRTKRNGASLKLNNPELVVYNSHWMARYYSHVRSLSMVLHPPVRALNRPRGALPAAAVSSITQVNLMTAKGVDTFWDLADRQPDRNFLGVMGGYGYQEVREDLDNVEIVPFTPNIEEIWSRTRVFLSPSWDESYGLACLEAMTFGVPVIANPTVGLRESLGDAGLFVDRDDLDGWVAMLGELDEPTVYAHWAQRAKEHAHARQRLVAEQMARFSETLRCIA